MWSQNLFVIERPRVLTLKEQLGRGRVMIETQVSYKGREDSLKEKVMRLTLLIRVTGFLYSQTTE